MQRKPSRGVTGIALNKHINASVVTEIGNKEIQTALDI